MEVAKVGWVEGSTQETDLFHSLGLNFDRGLFSALEFSAEFRLCLR